MSSGTPVITALRAIPVAGRDSMLLNLSGAHGPYFTRNLLIVTDSAGNTGVGEAPIALIIDRKRSEGGTRIFIPLTSASVLIGFLA